jgi:hypothetical protein
MMTSKLTKQIFSALLALTLLASTAAATLRPGFAPTLAATFTVPVAASFSTTVPANRQSLVQLQGSDAEGTSLVYATTSSPTHGALSNLNTATGYVVYTPTADFVGADSFTYTVTSGGETSSTGTVTISVTNAKTTITGTITDASGSPRSGKVTFILTQAVTTPAGLTPVGSSVSASLNSSGAFTVQVYPSRSMSPAAYYQVWFADSSNLKTELLGIYDIPASTGTVGFAGYKVTDTNLAARYTFPSLAGLEALTSAVASASLAQLVGVSRTTGKLQYWDGANLSDSLVSQDGGTVSVAGNLTVTGTLASTTTDAIGAKLGTGASTPTAGKCLTGTGVGTSAWIAGCGASVVSSAQLDYYRYRNALLEPAAIEQIKKGAFTYAIASNEYKIALLAWYTSLNGTTGRWEVRDPEGAQPLRGVTIRGLYAGVGYGTGSHAVIINPALATYDDPQATYFDRQYQLNTQLKTHVVPIDNPDSDAPFLVGAYGAIVTQISNYDTPYFVIVEGDGQWLNMHDEMGDLADPAGTSAGNGVWRFSGRPNMPVTKYMAAAARIGPGDAETVGVDPKGALTWVNLPSTWSKVPDATAYLFRDDGQSASVDTAKWTVFDTAGAGSEVSMHPDYQWMFLKGDAGASWGLNGVRSISTFTRATGRAVEFDIVLTSSDAAVSVGWTKTTAAGSSDWAHALVFDSATGKATIYEDGSTRGDTGGGSLLQWRIYHCKITLGASGTATYQIQGRGFTGAGSAPADLGSTTWATISAGTSSSATNTFKVFAHVYEGTAYLNDVKVY